ncbi:AzlD family protein [Rhizobium sp. 18065]|uniref:AzlD family protein n=1 Tax=Rhizobium sp. 18065 TaxID=2681411 RepID=UPI00190F34CD|nr:AzlD family protein [Rhizobium sp. 18065]
MNTLFNPEMVAIILASAIATYITRIGGYVLIRKMKNIPPRMEAALNAVPAAVLTTLVAPAFFAGGIEVKIALAVSLLAGLRLSTIPMLLAGWAVAVAIRHFGG